MPKYVEMQCGKCGIEFCVPDFFQKSRHEDGSIWYCPNGHQRVYRESDATKYRRERDNAVQQLARVELELADKQREIKRMRKRAAAGTCPCCQRTFSNMAVHIRKKHPGFVAEAINVVPLKKA